MSTALEWLGKMIAQKSGGYVCVTDVSNIMVAQDNKAHREVLLGSRMILPDGTPLSWIARLRGCQGMRRVCGPDLMLAAFEASVKTRWRHYLLGGDADVPELLKSRLEQSFPGAEIAGAYSPPFRPLSEEEDKELVARIIESKPDILWVGLGCPKQEKWMSDHEHVLKNIVQIGVGAAFNFHSGKIVRAPRLMRNNGLEWLHRLASEPRRLWRRYVLLAPKFVWASLVETTLGSYRRFE
ncbi:N-acetylglucosaminyldiphosphoundecaprenol N-acetyl-beta-D-mannosaminyltransferase [Bradyrhizobium sp. LB12.1]|uniref:WecB/TagA/CpsF family glycosyltransferase n=1 Tax=unclassified Bradyrhizobium TaxID=2631580 RepID=UPI003396AD96